MRRHALAAILAALSVSACANHGDERDLLMAADQACAGHIDWDTKGPSLYGIEGYSFLPEWEQRCDLIQRNYIAKRLHVVREEQIITIEATKLGYGR